ncbi:MAG: hypothetical protein U0270_19005 [Labilithrix sp.]
MRCGVAALALAFTSFAGCGEFGSTSDPPVTSDAGSTPAADAGRPPAKTDAQAAGGCASAGPDVLVCDDFEGSSISKAWTDTVSSPPGSTGEIGIEPLPPSMGSGHALHVKIMPEDVDRPQDTMLRLALSSGFLTDKRHIELRARVFVVSSTVNYARLAGLTIIRPLSGPEHFSVSGVSLWKYDPPFLEDGDDPSNQNGAITGVVGNWRSTVTTLDRAGTGPFERKVTADPGGTLREDTRDLSGTVDSIFLGVGAFNSAVTELAEGVGSLDVWIDDVLFLAR